MSRQNKDSGNTIKNLKKVLKVNRKVEMRDMRTKKDEIT